MNDLVVSSDKQFSRTLFGLNRTEVYNYLNQVSTACEDMKFQIQVLKEQNDKLSDTNRDNVLKIRDIQDEVTEAQRKTDKVNVELEAALKQITELKKELAASKKRTEVLTDELKKAGIPVPADAMDATTTTSAKAGTAKTEAPKSAKTAPKKDTSKDIFADMRNEAAAEKKAAADKRAADKKAAEDKKKAAAKPDTSKTSSADIFDDDEVYAGEVEIEVDESMLIGSDDDADEGFSFL